MATPIRAQFQIIDGGLSLILTTEEQGEEYPTDQAHQHLQGHPIMDFWVAADDECRMQFDDGWTNEHILSALETLQNAGFQSVPYL
jgi:hypothetical protein